jgi:hypothetical protein
LTIDRIKVDGARPSFSNDHETSADREFSLPSRTPARWTWVPLVRVTVLSEITRSGAPVSRARSCVRFSTDSMPAKPVPGLMTVTSCAPAASAASSSPLRLAAATRYLDCGK